MMQCIIFKPLKKGKKNEDKHKTNPRTNTEAKQGERSPFACVLWVVLKSQKTACYITQNTARLRAVYYKKPYYIKF